MTVKEKYIIFTTEDYCHRRQVSKKFLLKNTNIAKTTKFQVSFAKETKRLFFYVLTLPDNTTQAIQVHKFDNPCTVIIYKASVTKMLSIYHEEVQLTVRNEHSSPAPGRAQWHNKTLCATLIGSRTLELTSFTVYRPTVLTEGSNSPLLPF